MKKKKYPQRDKKSTPPSALIIFADGFDGAPVIVPNGGAEAVDDLIVDWFRGLLQQDNRKAAA
jgi:hypothetical protein